MDAQEIFDTVAKHLATQGRKSANSEGLCLYRGPNGTKCAVGCLITDREYNKGMEEEGAVSALWESGSLPERLAQHVNLLHELQATHDRCGTGRDVADRLRLIARGERLSPAILDTLTFPEKWA